MFCPRCGMQNTETTKYCRQCGLPLNQVAGYVALGGAGALIPPQPHPVQLPGPLPETPEMISLKQKKVLSMMIIPLIPLFLTIALGDLGGLIAIPWVSIPLAYVWLSFRFKAEMRRLQDEQIQQYLAGQQSGYQPTPQPPPAPPAFQPRPHQHPLPPQPTNRLDADVRSSVTEDETRRFPGKQ